MNRSLFARFGSAALFAAVFVLVLGSCSDWRGESYLDIGFGGSAGARSVPWPPDPAELSRMRIDVALDGPEGVREFTVEGISSHRVPVSPGRLGIKARASVDGALRAVGELPDFEVKPGRNHADIILKRPPAFSLSVSGTHAFPPERFRYASAPAGPAVTVKNEGSFPIGPLTAALSGGAASSFELSADALPGLSARNESAAFTVRPKTGLGIGTYAETVTVSGDGLSETFDVGTA